MSATEVLSADQQDLWVAAQLVTRPETYNVIAAYALPPGTEIDVLRERITALVADEYLLRSRVVEHEGQLIFKAGREARLHEDRIRLAPTVDHHTGMVERESRRPFILERGPLARFSVTTWSDGSMDLIICAHHLVVDERSMQLIGRRLLCDEIPVRRSGLLTHPTSPRPAGDQDTGSALQRTAPPSGGTLDWALGDPRREVSAGAREPLEITARTWTDLRSRAREWQVTTTSMALAALGLVLNRNAATEQTSLGISLTLRTPASWDTIGYFNALREIQVEHHDHQPLRDHVIATHALLQRCVTDARSRREGAAREQRDCEGTAVVAAIEDLAIIDSDWGQAIPYPDPDLGTAQFPITLYVNDSRAGSDASFVSYQFRWMNAGQARVLTRQLRQVLKTMADETASLSQLSQVRVLDPGSCSRALEQGRGIELMREESTVVQRVLDRVRSHPGDVALSCDETTLTYGELRAEVDATARMLRDAGVVAGDRVAVCLPRSVRAPVAMLAAMWLRAAYVPLDPHYPVARLRAICADSTPRVVATDVATAEQTGDLGCPAVLLDLDPGLVSGPTGPVQPHEAVPSDAAYVIYTSGSSGDPKGVVVEHRNVTNLLDAVTLVCDLQAREVWSVFHSFSFDFSVWELWGALMTGGHAVIVPYWTSRDPYEFHELLRRERVTILSQTPSAFSQLMSELQGSPADLDVTLVVFGGEPLDATSLVPWFDQYPGTQVQMVNMYGITETTVHCTYARKTRTQALLGDASVGLPLPGWEVHVLDRYGRCVAPGVTGELHVAGGGVARGYLGDPELTTGRFFYSDEVGARVYRSGDLGRRLPTGIIEHLGRADDQVKLRGFRIELGEIRAALRRIPDVVDAAAMMSTPEQGPGEPEIHAFLVLRKGATSQAIRDEIGAWLPSYMVPSRYFEVGQLPLTSNGKLDVGLLRARRERDSDSGLRVEPPLEVAEAQDRGAETELAISVSELRAIWQDILGIAVSDVDNFFEVGGTSLLATRVMFELRSRGFSEFRLSDLFRHATPLKLRAALMSTR